MGERESGERLRSILLQFLLMGLTVLVVVILMHAMGDALSPAGTAASG